jgi:DNA-binding beta-propeller fold protein YncE
MGMTSRRGPALAGLALITALAFAAPASASEGVYVVNGNSDGTGGISQFTIGASGTLAADTPATQIAGNGPQAFVISPNGEYAYVANAVSGTGVSQYTIGAGGTLTPDTPAGVAGGGSRLAVSPDGRYLYATAQVFSGTNGLAQYPIGAGGKLGTPVTVDTGSYPQGIAVSPNGSSVYVVNQGDSISEYSVASNGTLSLHATSPAGQLDNPQAIAITPNGQDVYVVNPYSSGSAGANGIEQYTVGAGGTLVADTTPVVQTGLSPQWLAISPNGQYAYVTDTNGVSQFSVGSGGMLVHDTPTEVTAGTTPTGITVSPDGRYAYVTNSDSNNISQYAIGPTGLLTANGAALPATNGGNPVPNAIAVAPDAGPTAAFTSTPAQAGAASTLTSTSTDADEPITSEIWNFGDGTTGSGSPAAHVYATPGVYTVTLNVNDAAGCANAFPFFSAEAGPFTGQLSACSPGAVTVASETVTIPGPGTAGFGAIKIKAPTITGAVACAGISIQTCDGTLTLTTVEHLKGHKLTAITAKKKVKKTTRTVTLGSATYSLSGGAQVTLTITLNANGKKLLDKKHKIPARLSLITAGATTPSATKTLTITLRRAKRKRHR